MRTRLRFVAAVFSSVVFAAACGGVAVVEDDGGGGGATGTTATGVDPCSDVQMDDDFGIDECSTPEQCVLHGRRGGKPVREECNEDRCVLYVDGALTCTCAPDQINWAGTCATGHPTCASWKFNYTDLRQCK